MMPLALVLLLPHIIFSQDFGESINETQLIETQTFASPLEAPRIGVFEVYVGDGGEDMIKLAVHIPVYGDNFAGQQVANIYIIDFRQYSTSDNPIENNTVELSLITNCSNVNSAFSLNSYFSGDSETADSDTDANDNDAKIAFFQHDFVQYDNKTYLQYLHDGPLREFSACEAQGRDNLWSAGLGGQESTEQTTVLVLNNIIVKKEEQGNVTHFQESFFSTTFQLTWKISQYLVVNAMISSQKRVEAELIFASVQPQWENNVLTGETLAFIGIRTTLDNAYFSHSMMGYIDGTAKCVVPIDDVTYEFDIPAAPSPYIEDARCDKTRNYGTEEGLVDVQVGNYDCQQIWEFTILLPQDVISDHKSLTGAFFFELELYTCIDLDDSQLNCVTVDEAGAGFAKSLSEEIFAEITVNTVVEVTSERENVMRLEVTDIMSKDESVNFQYRSFNSRGIYHKEEVIIKIAPTQNYTLIHKYGLRLAAFFVCIQSRIPQNSKLGCLEVEQEYRYIAYMEQDLSMSIQGKTFTRDDFEQPKQKLTRSEWDPSTQFYTIEFANLALSGASRLYKMTMIFKVDGELEEDGTRDPESRDLSKRDAIIALDDMIENNSGSSEDTSTSEDTTEDTPEDSTDTEEGPDNLMYQTHTDTDTDTHTDTHTDTDSHSGTEDVATEAVVTSSGCPEQYEYVDLDSDCLLRSNSGVPRLQVSGELNIFLTIAMTLVLCDP